MCPYEEFFEILTLKQLCRHNKPIAIYNLLNYYDELNATMEKAMDKNFIKRSCSGLYELTDDVDRIISYIERPADDSRRVSELKDG